MPGLHIMSGDWMLMAHGSVSAAIYRPFRPARRRQGLCHFDGHADGRARNRLGPRPVQVDAQPRAGDGPARLSQPLRHWRDGRRTAAGRSPASARPVHGTGRAGRFQYRRGTSLFLYGGPVGEPALGPSAFMHRGSSSYNPEPPITHHWFDSTHITYGVVTAGISAPQMADRSLCLSRRGARRAALEHRDARGWIRGQSAPRSIPRRAGRSRQATARSSSPKHSTRAKTSTASRLRRITPMARACPRCWPFQTSSACPAIR